MIKEYETGEDFIKENEEYLKKDIYGGPFFFLDAPLLIKNDADNYAIKVEKNDKILLILKVIPYNSLLLGDSRLIDTAIEYIISKKYNYDGYLCSRENGERLVKVFHTFNKEYYLHLSMDYMICNQKYEINESEIEHATTADIDELYEDVKQFIIDCNLIDEVPKENIAKNLDRFRLIRKDGKIASFAEICDNDDKYKRVSFVYTKKEYRGKGYAEKVVGSILNEAINLGYGACLNVDTFNPISNHVYEKLGFKKVYYHGEYRIKKNI